MLSMQDIVEPQHKERIVAQAGRLAGLPNWLPGESTAAKISAALDVVASTWLMMGPQLDSLPNAQADL